MAGGRKGEVSPARYRVLAAPREPKTFSYSLFFDEGITRSR